MRHLVFAISLFFPFAASAQVVQKEMKVVCMPSDHFRSVLQRHKEAPVILGITSAGRLFEVWVSKDGATWTAAITDGQSKMTCALADGENMQNKTDGGM